MDCDEVLLKTAESHHLMRKIKYGIEDDYVNKYPSQWVYEHSELTDYNTSTEKFTSSYDFSGIEAVKNAVLGVNKLKQANFKLHVVTSITDERLTKLYRQKNLQYIFGDVFEDVTCLPLGHNNKKDYYQSVPKGIVIDDSPHNIMDAVACGHEGIFIAIAQNKEWYDKMSKMRHVTVKKDLLDAADFLIEKNLFRYAHFVAGRQK